VKKDGGRRQKVKLAERDEMNEGLEMFFIFN